MKISSSNLEAFFSVSKTRSFSGSARELRITQSALSQRILNLEDWLGAKLFIRDRSGIRLTENGEMLLRYCQTHAALEEEVLSRISRVGVKAAKKEGELGGTIRIAGFSSVTRSLIMPMLSPLIRANPGIKVEVMSRELHELPGLLRSGATDFVVTDRVLDDSELEFRHLGLEENVLIEAKDGKGRSDVYLDHDPDDRMTVRFMEFQGKAREARRLNRSYLDDIYGILDGVAMGWGRAVVPFHLARSHPGVRILTGYRPLKVPVVLHYYRQPYYSELHEAALRCLEGSDPFLMPAASKR